MPIADWKKYQTDWRVFVYGTIWVGYLLGNAVNYARTGEPNPWAMPVLFIGLILFLVAKVSIVPKTGFPSFTFGWSAAKIMSTKMKWCYYDGYLVMIAGFLLAFRH